MSPQLHTISQTMFFTGMLGGCWGGFLQSREAYLNFIQRNQATRFPDQYVAKVKAEINYSAVTCSAVINLSDNILIKFPILIMYHLEVTPEFIKQRNNNLSGLYTISLISLY